MSGPPGSQVAPKKNKRKHNNNGKQQADDNGNDTSPAEGSKVADNTAAGAGPSPSSAFQAPRQPNVYVDPCPVGELYAHLRRATNGGGGGSRKQANNGKRRTTALQREFSELPFPRGMVNNSNFCFMNSILQALLFIPSFSQLAVSVSCDPPARENCPTLTAFGKWALQYWKPGFTRLAIVAPTLMPKAKAGGGTTSQRILDGSVQEDAQEFLQKLLECIQQELVQLEGQLEKESATGATSAAQTAHAAEEGAGPSAGQKGWTVVKGKEKLAVREHVDADGQSRLLSSIFGGTLESHLQGKQRQRDRVSVLVEPFFCVPVDIGFAPECSIEQALEHTFMTEHIYDTEREKNLKKTLRLGQLPSILLLQLRRWTVTREGYLVKLDNTVHLKRTLQLPRNICGDETLANAERSYRLLSVVCHRGDAVGRGHYVTYLVDHAANPDVLKVQATAGKANEASAARSAPASSSVILCNDTSISVVPARGMEKETVYFLVYQRAST